MTPAAPEAVLFDAGGTLIRMHPALVGDLVEPHTGQRPDPELLASAQYQVMHDLLDPHWVADHPDGWWPAWVARVLAQSGVDPRPEAVRAVANAPGLWRLPIPGARETVERVRAAGYRVAVVSNADGTVARDLAAAGFDADLFEEILDSSLEGVSKPDPEIFHRALGRLGVDAERAWYVGDSAVFDVAGGRNAGLAAVVLVDPLRLAPNHRPRIDSIAQLPDVLAGAQD